MIAKCDKVITDVKAELNQLISEISFTINDSVTFILNEDINMKIFDSLKGAKGIYFFEINIENFEGVKIATKLDNLEKKWGMKKFHSEHSSNIIKQRLKYQREQFSNTQFWVPLYIGKCQDIHKRIIEHIYLEPSKRTYAMKLKHRENLYENLFRVSYLKLDVENYDFIAVLFEKELRNKYKPIVGKQ